MLVRKKPIIVEAVQLATQSDWSKLEEFAPGFVDREDELHMEHYFVYDRLHDSWIQFYLGDWIIKGVQGEFYPCNGPVFADTYEIVESE